jgi:hypothetical protein
MMMNSYITLKPKIGIARRSTTMVNLVTGFSQFSTTAVCVCPNPIVKGYSIYAMWVPASKHTVTPTVMLVHHDAACCQSPAGQRHPTAHTTPSNIG